MKFRTGNAPAGKSAKLVRDTAKGMAGAFYDAQDVFGEGRYVRTDAFRIKVPSQDEFVRDYWRDFVPLAREQLAKMLSMPGVSQGDKDAIYDALLQERGAQTDAEQIAPSIMRVN